MPPHAVDGAGPSVAFFWRSTISQYQKSKRRNREKGEKGREKGEKGKGGEKEEKKGGRKKGAREKGRKGAWCLPKEILVTSKVLTSLVRVNNLWFILGNRGRPQANLLDAPSSKLAFLGLLRVEQIRLDTR